MDSIENLLIVETFLYMQGLFSDPTKDEILMEKRNPQKAVLPNEPSFFDELKKREDKL
jgi:hypothetical protein